MKITFRFMTLGLVALFAGQSALAMVPSAYSALQRSAVPARSYSTTLSPFKRRTTAIPMVPSKTQVTPLYSSKTGAMYPQTMQAIGYEPGKMETRGRPRLSQEELMRRAEAKQRWHEREQQREARQEQDLFEQQKYQLGAGTVGIAGLLGLAGTGYALSEKKKERDREQAQEGDMLLGMAEEVATIDGKELDNGVDQSVARLIEMPEERQASMITDYRTRLANAGYDLDALDQIPNPARMRKNYQDTYHKLVFAWENGRISLDELRQQVGKLSGQIAQDIEMYKAAQTVLKFKALQATAAAEKHRATRDFILSVSKEIEERAQKYSDLYNKHILENLQSFIDEKGEFALINAVKKASPSVVKALLEKGFDPNFAELSLNLLTEGILKSDSPGIILELLLQHGADPNVVDFNITRQTPLMYAASENQPESVKILLKHGAYPNAVDFVGQTAFDKTNNPEIKKMLLEARPSWYNPYGWQPTGWWSTTRNKVRDWTGY